MGDDRHALTIGRVEGDPLVYARPNSYFTIGAPRPTTVGGLPAQEVSLLLSPTATSTDGFALAPFARGGSTIDLLPLRVMYAGSTCRVITVQVHRQQVVIVAQRPTLDTTNFDQQVQAILASISFN
jgi:hypothetical protein